MQKIVVLNVKGGSGKTTISSNLASYFATQALSPALLDMDCQGSSLYWLSKRGMEHPKIHGIAGADRNSRVTRTFALRIPSECQRLIVDTPAAVDPLKLPEITRGADAILIPVMPTDIDIHATTKCIKDLLLVAKVSRQAQSIGVIANRVKKNTIVYHSLMRFLETLNIPVLTTIKDSQHYVRAAEHGIGIFEMRPQRVREELEQWLPLIGWLSKRSNTDMQSVAVPQALRTAAPRNELPPLLDPTIPDDTFETGVLNVQDATDNLRRP
jgi:chromosome partitioning protein